MKPLATDYATVLRYREKVSSPETEARNRQSMLAALDSTVAGDVEALTNLFHPDIVFYEADCLPYGGTHRGIEATKAAVASLFETYSLLHMAIEGVLATGDIVIVQGHVNFRVRKNGRTGDFPVCEMYRFRDGKIIEWRVFYFDSNMVATALAAT